MVGVPTWGSRSHCFHLLHICVFSLVGFRGNLLEAELQVKLWAEELTCKQGTCNSVARTQMEDFGGPPQRPHTSSGPAEVLNLQNRGPSGPSRSFRRGPWPRFGPVLRVVLRGHWALGASGLSRFLGLDPFSGKQKNWTFFYF